MQRKFVCIVCPSSCYVEVEYEGTEITAMQGAECQKGKEFVRNEIKHPLRTFTGSVKVIDGDFPLVSVKTTAPVPKQDLKAIGKLTHQLTLDAPVEIGQIIANNLLEQGVDLVATRTIRCKQTA